MPGHARRSDTPPPARPAEDTNNGLYGYLNELRLADPSRSQSASRRIGKLTASGNNAPSKRHLGYGIGGHDV